jgi:peptidase E
MVAFYRFFSTRAEPFDLTLFDRRVQDLEGFLLSQDVIYVGGGNTANMLAVWRVHGVDEILKAAWEQGVVLCGSSAGANCWFEASITDSFGPALAPLHDGLGFLQGSFCPHYDSELQRRPTYELLVSKGFPPGYASDDAAALHFVGTELVECVSAQAEAGAYRVELMDDEVVQTSLMTRFLG